MIQARSNNIKVKELADEQGLKVAQNVAAGVAGLVVWPLWFAMDFKGAASKDVAALRARQQYLAALAISGALGLRASRPNVHRNGKGAAFVDLNYCCASAPVVTTKMSATSGALSPICLRYI